MSVTFVLNDDGFNALRNSAGVMAALNEQAQQIASSAGEGFTVDPAEAGAERAHAFVYADSWPAKVAEATDHVLLRAIGRG